MATSTNTVAADILINLVGDFSLSIYLLPVLSLAYRIQTLKRYYGLATSVVLNISVRNLWVVEAEILSSSDDKLATTFREAHQSECNMTAVTSALVASISTAALALPDLEQTKWPAEALFVASLVFSLISVFTASKQQKVTGRLLRPRGLRRYIRVRKDVVTGLTCSETKKPSQTWGAYIAQEMSEDDAGAGDSLCVYLPSPVSCLMLSAPRLLLAASLTAFILGVGVFIGSLAFTETGDSLLTRNRNVFIVYCVTAAFGFSLYIQSSLVQWSQKASDPGDRIMEDLSWKRRDILKRLKLRTNTDYLRYLATHTEYPSMPLASASQQSVGSNKSNKTSAVPASSAATVKTSST